MLIFYQFHFQFVFGYQLKTARCSSKITNESIVIHGDKSNCAWNIQLKYLRRMANICLFQMTFSQWRPAQIIFAFPKNFFCKGSQHYAHKISRSTDQPFKLFAIFLVISWTNTGSTVFLYFLIFIIVDLLKIPFLTHSALINALIRHDTLLSIVVSSP